MERKVYGSRRAAVRAARNACRRALNAPGFQAFEGPDFEIHPVHDESRPWLPDYSGPSYYILRGPAKEAVGRST